MNPTGLGSPMTIQSVDTLILFDLMSHSVQSYVYQMYIAFFPADLSDTDSGTLVSVTMGKKVLTHSHLSILVTSFASDSV
jgi:hypothetical protein